MLPTSGEGSTRQIPMADAVRVDASSAEVLSLGSVSRRLLKGSSWVFFGKIGSMLMGVTINALLARLLTPAEFGAYLTTFTIVIIGHIFAQLGLDRTVVRLVAAALGTGQQGRARNVIKQITIVGTCGALVVGAIFSFGLGPLLAERIYHSGLLATIVPVVGGWLVVTAIQSLFVDTFRGLQRFDLATLFDAVLVDLLMVTTFAVLFVLRARVGLEAAVAISAAMTTLVTIVAGLSLLRQVRRLRGPGDVRKDEILDMAWPSLVTSVATYFVGSGLDLLVLGAFRPEAEVALYGAATRLVWLVATPLVIVGGALHPLLAELHARGKNKELERTARAGATLAGLPSFVVLLIFILFGRTVMGHLYGPFYRHGAEVLAILSVARMFAVWTGACGMTLIMTGHQKAMMYIAVFTGPLSLLAGIAAAPRFGAVGVAIASASTIVLQNALALLLARRLVGVWTQVELSPKALYQYFFKKDLAAR
jgi:O-antigen/teichoic acid export membrane protein